MRSLADADVERLDAVSRHVRRSILETLEAAGGGHFGGSLSVVEILVALYGSILRIDPVRPDWPDRDRLILSKGHAAAAYCAILAHVGYFDEGLLATFNKLDSAFGMHPDMHKIPGCDMSTGSLGHGLPVGIGMALAGLADRRPYRVYVIMGDGECHEGSVWESAMVASHRRLSQLTAVIDRNRVCLDGNTDEILSLEPFAERWRCFGWHVFEVDGHDHRQLHAAFRAAQDIVDRPTVIIANTVKGKGISFMEGKHEYHYAVLTGKELATARMELGSSER